MRYKKNIRMVITVLKGKSTLVISDMNARLKQLSQEQKYENALIIRNKILRFTQTIEHKTFHENNTAGEYNRSQEALSNLLVILKPYYPELKSLHRIECYDISNTSQSLGTGSMVVLVDGLIDKSHYKKFRIRSQSARSDFQMLYEVLSRRFRNRWEMPNLVVLDGGRPQIKIAERVMKEHNLNIPIIGIAKNPDRIITAGLRKKTLHFLNQYTGFNLIRLIRDESHRFARKYHLLLRQKQLIPS